MKRTATLLIAVLGASLAIAAPAMAATYYASPSGGGNCSTPGTPCSLSSANDLANTDGSEIVLAPGTYTVTTQITNSHQISIHGEDGQARPVIAGNTSSGAVLNLSGGATLRDLEIDQAGHSQGLDLDGSGTLDRVLVDVTTSNAFFGIFVEPGASYTMRDTAILMTSGDIAKALATDGSLDLRNVTILAPAATAMIIQNFQDNDVEVDAKNVIVRGGQRDIVQSGGSMTTDNILRISYSNYRPANSTFSGTLFDDSVGHNQTADPTFASDGYHEAAGSPTIGAGAPDASGHPLDIDRDVRYVGAPDIGADQYVRAGTETIGETRDNAAPCGTGGGFAMTQFSVGGPPDYAATANGVITSWSTYVGSAVDTDTVSQLQVYDPATPMIRSQGPVETALTPSAVNTFGASPGIPIHAGDTVALGKPSGKDVFCTFFTGLGASGDSIAEVHNASNDQPQPGDHTQLGFGTTTVRVDVQALVEPDADGDGYGDVTQDGCPASAASHGTCPTPTGTQSGTTTETAGNGGPTGTEPGGQSNAPDDFFGARLKHRTLKVVGRYAVVEQTCDRACHAKDTLTGVLTKGRLKAAAKRKKVTVGRKSFTLSRAGTAHVKIKLSKLARKWLRKHRRLKLTLKTVSTDGTGDPVHSSAKVTLKLAKRKR